MSADLNGSRTVVEFAAVYDNVVKDAAMAIDQIRANAKDAVAALLPGAQDLTKNAGSGMVSQVRAQAQGMDDAIKTLRAAQDQLGAIANGGSKTAESLDKASKGAAGLSKELGGAKNIIGQIGPLLGGIGGMSGPLGSAVGSLTSLLSLNPATLAAGFTALAAGIVNHIIELDNANVKAANSLERLTRLYGEAAVKRGDLQATNVYRTTEDGVLRQLGEEGQAKTLDDVRERLRKTRSEIAAVQREAADFGFSEAEIEKMAAGQLATEINTTWENYKNEWKRTADETHRRFNVGIDASYSGPEFKDRIAAAQEFESRLKAVADQEKALADMEKQLDTATHKTPKENIEARIKAAKDLAEATKKAVEAAYEDDRKIGDRQERKAEERGLADNPANAVLQHLEAENRALADIADLRSRLVDLQDEAKVLQERQSGLNDEDLARIKEIAREREKIETSRKQAVALAERAAELGERAARAAEEEAKRQRQVTEELARKNIELVKNIRNRAEEAKISLLDGPQRALAELDLRQRRELEQADENKITPERRAELMAAQTQERQITLEAMRREAGKNWGATMDDHMAAMLPKEYQARWRMAQQFAKEEEEAMKAVEAGLLSPGDLDQLRTVQKERMRQQVAEEESAKRVIKTEGFLGGVELPRSVLQGTTQAQGKEQEKIVKLSQQSLNVQKSMLEALRQWSALGD